MHRRTLARLAMLAVPVVAFASLIATPASSQSKATFQQWAGKTSQGLPLRFAVVTKADGSKLVSPEDFQFFIVCPVSGDHVGVEASFSGFFSPLTDGAFRFALLDLDSEFRWSGAVASNVASGDVEFAFPAFAPPTETVQDCSSHHLPWAGKPSAATSGGSAPDLHVTFTKDARGRVSERIERASH